MAFQPIVDVVDRSIFAYEALVRGVNGEGAGSIFAQLTDDNLYAFDQRCRVKAIELAASIGLMDGDAKLSINFMPRAIYEPRACIKLTLETGRRCAIPPERLIFEFTETEQTDKAKLAEILTLYRALGFETALDDFGSGYAGLSLLADMPPGILKLDMALIRNIDSDPVRHAIVKNLFALGKDLGVKILCEGVETEAELLTLRHLGARLVQGYYICRPAFEALRSRAQINFGG